MKPDLELKRLDRNLLDEDCLEIFDGIYYNSFAIFAVSLINEQARLKEEWKNLQAAIAGFIHNNRKLDKFFGDKDIKFDTYLIFLTDFKVNLNLKTEIENNRYFCKKVILEYDKKLSLADNLKQLILFQKIEDENMKQGEYISEDKFQGNLARSVKEEKEAFKLLERNITELDKDDYQEIINQWLAEVK